MQRALQQPPPKGQGHGQSGLGKTAEVVSAGEFLALAAGGDMRPLGKKELIVTEKSQHMPMYVGTSHTTQEGML